MKQLTLIFSLKNEMTLIVRCIELFYDNYLVYFNLLTRSFLFLSLLQPFSSPDCFTPRTQYLYHAKEYTSAVSVYK